MYAVILTYAGERPVDANLVQLGEADWNDLASGGDPYAIDSLPVLASNQRAVVVGDEFGAVPEWVETALRLEAVSDLLTRFPLCPFMHATQ